VSEELSVGTGRDSRLEPIFVAGPTAVGKSEVAIGLAERLGGEIVSVDSMQVYRGLDIGTAKPSIEERARVPHHLIDVVELSDNFDAARFVGLAQRTVGEIQARGHVPILCGGTGLYFRAFLEGLGEAPPADARLRAELEAAPFSDLLRELAERDPATYERIDRQNPRRVIRAVEVIRLTGKPFSEQRADWGSTRGKQKSDERIEMIQSENSSPSPRPSPGEGEIGDGASPFDASSSPRHHAVPRAFFPLSREMSDLRKRIDTRVEAMFGRGLVEETERLLNRGLAENKTAMQALGYRQVVEHLRGERSLPETVELVKIRTRQFAKRQMTWFRKQTGIQWIQIAPQEGSEVVVEKVFQLRAA
jgi:tRNA dimethylallyltransferase